MAMHEAPPFWWRKPGWQAILLSPFSWVYGQISARRMALPPSQSVELPVICVGNFVAGGAGKTPTVLALVKKAKSLGYQPGILSRGHGGGITLASVVDLDKHNSRDVGDEPLFLAQAATTVVSVNRPAGATLLAESGCDIIIMDDGFQNPGLRKDFNLIVVDAKRGLGNGFAHPAGPLRVPVARQLPFADAVVIIGEGNGADKIIRLAAIAAKPIQLARVVVKSAKKLKGKELLAFAGIGDPDKFFNSLMAIGAKLIDRRSFGDHHHYLHEEIDELLAKAKAQDLQLVSTAKDIARLKGLGQAEEKLVENTRTVEIELQFDDPGFTEHVIRKASATRDARV